MSVIFTTKDFLCNHKRRGMGKDEKRQILMIYANRKSARDVVRGIKDIHPKAMIVSNDVSNVSGGYIIPFRKLLK